MNSRSFLFLFLISSLFVTGCGGGSSPDRGPVGELTGSVTFEGEPVTEGHIYLQHVDGSSAGAGGAEIQSDGTYTVQGQDGGIPAGKYVVWFAAPEVPLAGLGENDPPEFEIKDMPNMPQRYRSMKTSKLEVAVGAGSTTHDFDMTP